MMNLSQFTQLIFLLFWWYMFLFPCRKWIIRQEDEVVWIPYCLLLAALQVITLVFIYHVTGGALPAEGN